MTCQGRGFNCQLVDGPTRILMKLFRDDDDDQLFTVKGDYRVKLSQIACVEKRIVTFLYPRFPVNFLSVFFVVIIICSSSY